MVTFVLVTFVLVTFVLVTFFHISNISAVTNPFWTKLKSYLLGRSWTDVKYYGDIWPCNICPGDICPYQQYLLLNQFWPNFEGRFLGPFLREAICQGNRHYLSWWYLSIVDDSICTKLFGPSFVGPNFFWLKFCYTQTFFLPKLIINCHNPNDNTTLTL